MLTNKMKRRLTAAAVFVLPVLLVKIAAFLVGQGEPSSAAATAQLVTSAAAGTLTTSEQAPRTVPLTVVEHIAWLRRQPAGATPLYHRRAKVRPRGKTSKDPVPEFVVQAIMVAPSGNTTLIDGKVRRVGEKLGATGWRVVEIDGRVRSVTIEQTSTGQRIERSVRMSR